MRCIFSDVDGTLLDSGHRLPEALRRKIQALPVPFILVSSRPPGAMEALWDSVSPPRHPMVCFGGALILGARREVLRSVGLPWETAARLRSAVAGRVHCSVYAGFDWIAPDDEWSRGETAIVGIKPRQGKLAEGAEVHKLLCMGEPDRIAALEKQLRREYPECAVARSKDTYLEIMDGRANKGEAVRFLCAHYGIDPKDALSFGDNFNDVDMLRATGKSVAMGNAPDEVKAQATDITLDSDHDGVLLYLEKLFPDE